MNVESTPKFRSDETMYTLQYPTITEHFDEKSDSYVRIKFKLSNSSIRRDGNKGLQTPCCKILIFTDHSSALHFLSGCPVLYIF